jgi:hypothetical protein
VKNLIKRDFFAQLCTLDLDLVVTPPTEESKEATVRYYLRRPRDGSFSMSSGSTLAQFEAEFGKLFGEEETGGQ